MQKVKKTIHPIGRYLLYGILFSSIAFVATLFQGKNFTHVIPTASADVPATGSDSGVPSDGTGDSGGGSCDSSGDAGGADCGDAA